MSRPPSDRELDRLLAGLPRECAPAGFSRRVLERLGEPERPLHRRRWLLAAGAAALALAVAIWLLPRTHTAPPPADVLALEEQHRRLVEELESVKAGLRELDSGPVLYLGGDEEVDLVLDLSPVWHGEAAGRVLPATRGGADRARPAVERRQGERR